MTEDEMEVSGVRNVAKSLDLEGRCPQRPNWIDYNDGVHFIGNDFKSLNNYEKQ